MWELLQNRAFWITGQVTVDSPISSSHYPATGPWMVLIGLATPLSRLENLDFAKYLEDPRFPLGKFKKSE